MDQNNGGNPADVNPANGADHSAEEAALTEAEAALAELHPNQLAAKTLAGDLRDFVIELLRDLREPWHKLPESQQSYFAQKVSDRCYGLVTEAVNLIAARDFTSIAVSLEQVAFKPKGIEAKLSLAAISHEIRHALVDAQGQPVLIVVADPKVFAGARGPAKIDKQALFDAPPRDDADGEAAGPLFANGAADANPDARHDGYQDGLAGVRDKAARWPSGEPGHGGYELGWSEGEELLAASLAEAREAGAVAGKAGADRLDNPHPSGTPLHEAWLVGWIAQDAEAAPPVVEAAAPPPKRRGRPRKAADDPQPGA